MLAKKLRIAPARQIERVFKKGRRQAGKNIVLFSLPNRLAFSRFGVILSSKAFPKATKRNHLKRQVFAVLRELFPQVRAGFDLLVKIKKEVAFEEYKKDLEECLKMVRLRSP